MRMLEIILKKRSGAELTKDDILFFIDSYTKGTTPDYQVSALLMAIYFNGMTDNETAYLTEAMMNSGKVVDLSGIPTYKVDKHSTGGVGDKISLILAPLAAACGLCVPMISGRGLGHTGGTLDKLESIPGFNVNLSLAQFKKMLKKINVCMIGQTKEIAPADKKLYALRDVTATVESIPLICGSIMSKKLAEGIDGLVLDVKVGSGAFMKDLKSAKRLAGSLVKIAKSMNKSCFAFLTDMSEPLGSFVGNTNEVIESIEILKGNVTDRQLDLSVILVGKMLELAKVATFEEGKKKALDAIQNGSALEKFRELVKLHSGDVRCIDDYKILPKAKYKFEVKAKKSGYVSAIDTTAVGLSAVSLGAGRSSLADKIDHGCGIEVVKKIADDVKKGDTLGILSYNSKKRLEHAKELFLGSYTISKEKPKRKKLILGISS
ncbi:thymidine phosphorylase [Thermodesulfobacteriota bacterium]